MSRRYPEQGRMACSFCHKSQGNVGQLISSPSDYPRAYICDECIMICASIIEDDSGRLFTASPGIGQFFLLVQEWIERHDRGEDISAVLDQMRILGRQIVGPEKNEPIRFEPSPPI